VHSAECAEGVGRIDNSPVGAGLSYLMNRVRTEMYEMLPGEITWQIFCLFFPNLLFSILFVIANIYSNLSTAVTVQMLQLTVHSVHRMAQ